jgi:hypothetical protein
MTIVERFFQLFCYIRSPNKCIQADFTRRFSLGDTGDASVTDSRYVSAKNLPFQN